jgi:hypothetical protein
VIGLSGAGVGTVTSIATSAPITGGTITTTGTIGISAATTGAAGSMSAADKTKLDGIEANADVTDATNVTAAGALMDSEVTNLADVKAFDPADYATAAQGTTANNALPKAGGTMSGNITMAGSQTVDGRDLSVDGAKLDGIATGATAYTDSDAISAVEGEATLALSGDVTIAAGKDLTVDTNTLHVDATNNRVGIGTTSPEMSLDVKQAITTIARVASTGSHANLRFGRANASYDAAMLFYDDMATTPSLQWRIQMSSGGTNLTIRDEDGSPDGLAIMTFKDGGGVDINTDVTIAAGHDLIFGDKTAVAALGTQVVNPDAGGGNPSAAELASTQAAITALQAKLDALIASLSNIGLV